MIKIYVDKTYTKTRWIRGRYLGRAYGWEDADTKDYVGDEHPNSKYSTPIQIMSEEEFNKRLGGD